jgi:hypothetical protein
MHTDRTDLEHADNCSVRRRVTLTWRPFCVVIPVHDARQLLLLLVPEKPQMDTRVVKHEICNQTRKTKEQKAATNTTKQTKIHQQVTRLPCCEFTQHRRGDLTSPNAPSWPAIVEIRPRAIFCTDTEMQISRNATVRVNNPSAWPSRVALQDRFVLLAFCLLVAILLTAFFPFWICFQFPYPSVPSRGAFRMRLRERRRSLHLPLLMMRGRHHRFRLHCPESAIRTWQCQLRSPWYLCMKLEWEQWADFQLHSPKHPSVSRETDTRREQFMKCRSPQ